MDSATTIREAKEIMLDDLDEYAETHCPCCGVFMKVYKWKLISTITRALINLYNLGGNEKYVDFNSFQIGKGGSFVVAKHFGLLIHKEKDPNVDKRASGYWKLSEKGVAFVEGRDTINKYVYIFRNKAIDFDEDQVDIVECLGEKFSYRELMNAR